ncbi:hypothetical protein A500_10934 [Clostridium sartagoforme AAU1]|uniref:SH3b domain-containing protein n=1 Tax=Clostridium sartagoforme AAU1 TaxID=1202534 RepID=R9C7Y3_9CLOT|nr:SH3 domain-containing protein [Clostridium sartagoforme]EOR25120.1 hypothetical protein A500_10934 [Clostridium sartagoforme AAU1]
MIKKLPIILMSFIIAASITSSNTQAKAEALNNKPSLDTEVIQPMDDGTFRLLVSATVYTSPSEMSYAITKLSAGTTLRRVESGPTYDSVGRAWYHISSFQNNYTGWVLGSTGVLQ